MNIRSVLMEMVIFPIAVVVSVAAETASPLGFADAVARTGRQYRDAVTVVTNDANAPKLLDGILAQEPADSINARHARILLARLQHPKVFAEFGKEIQKWREDETTSKPYGGRTGFLSGMLMQFVNREPESKYVKEHIRDEDGRIVFEPSGPSKGEVTLRGLHAKRLKVEKYTNAEVQAGIERNAAARQAVLEHVLKFLDEGDAYEQSEIVELLNRLWGHNRLTRAHDLPVINHVHDVDALIEAIFHNTSRPAAARMRAAFYLADLKPLKVQTFMLDIVTQASADDMCHRNETILYDALYYLRSSGDTNALAVLKTQISGREWKREKIQQAIHALEGRLSTLPMDR